MPLSNRQEFQLFGMFGFPLAHTLSPTMQEAAFRHLHIKAFYLPFEVDPQEFCALMRRSQDLLLNGFNVTVPYKEEILKYLDEINPSAKAIGAVNTVVRKGKKWVGFNTDELGFVTSLEKEARFQPRGRNVLILGAGGSARAVAYGLAKCGAKKIILANRTVQKAQKIASEYRRLFSKVAFEVAPSPRAVNPIGIDLVVNATSVGLRPGDQTLILPKLFHKKALFVDLIYKSTEFLRSAKNSGHRTLNGLGMLVYQGAEAFRLWTGRKAPIDVMKKAIVKL